MNIVIQDIFLKFSFSTRESCIRLTMVHHFLPKTMKTQILQTLVCSLGDRKEYIVHTQTLK